MDCGALRFNILTIGNQPQSGARLCRGGGGVGALVMLVGHLRPALLLGTSHTGSVGSSLIWASSQ